MNVKDLQEEVVQQQIEYWQTRLLNTAMLELPTDKLHPATQSLRTDNLSFTVPLTLTEQLKQLSQRENVPLFVTLLAVFQVLLHRYSHQDDIIIGTPAPNNPANLLALRTDFSDNPSFAQFLTQVKTVTDGAYAHQDLAFAKLLEVLNLPNDSSRHPLFQVLFALENDLDNTNTGFDLELKLSETEQGLVGTVKYATDLFESSTIQRLLGHFQTLLASVIANPNTHLAELPLLTESERHQLLVTWNNSAVEFTEPCFIHQLFEQQVERTPDATAIVYKDQQLTYKELNTRANQIAHYLRELGVKPETLVGICVERSLDQVIGLLGILKSGGAYIPLDVSYPKERLAFMLENNAPKALLTQTKLANLFEDFRQTIAIVSLNENNAAWTQQPTTNPDHHAVGLTPENLAYVMYTSGSTGKPKGACVLHRNLHNQLSWYINELALNPSDSVLLLTSYAYALTQRATFGPLLAGAKLVLAPEPFDPKTIVTLIAKEQISLINLTASGFHALIDVSEHNELSSLKRVVTAGEPLRIDQLINLPEPRPDIINNYGATECAAAVMYYRVSLTDIERYRNKIMPIGKPIWNCHIHLLDSHKQLVPIGVTGEIYIGGYPVGRGYLNRPDLTAEAFIPNPFVDDKTARIFKTGDLGRRLPDGTVEFLGRSDFQVKIRGFRIELGEIESALRQHPQIREVIVSVYEPVTDEKRLVAYLVAQGNAPTASELKEFLKPKLPEFMVPSTYVMLDAMPMTPNGKLDRKGLPDPTLITDGKEHTTPVNEIERELINLWQKLLGNTHIGTQDNFFDLGGHSLLAVTVITEVKKLFHVELPLSAIYQAPTVQKLAELILSDEPTASWYSLVPIQTQGSRPPLYAIHTITLLDLPRYLGKEQPLYFLRYGMAGEMTNRSVPLPPLAELADHYVKEIQQLQPQGPYHIMGFSFGGLIAYEMARQLRASGQKVSFLGLLDTYLTRERLPLPLHQNVRKLLKHSPAQMFAWLKNKISEKMSDDKYGTDFWPHIYTAAPDVASRNGYQPEPYDNEVILFQGDEWDSIFYSYDLPEHAWRELLGDKLIVEHITGEHFEICEEPHVKLLAEKITQCMNKAMAG